MQTDEIGMHAAEKVTKCLISIKIALAKFSVSWLNRMHTVTTEGFKMSWFSKLEKSREATKDLPGIHTFVQLSTVRGPGSGRLAGRPAIRTVNIRKVSQDELVFISDTRSGKADDVLNGSSKHAEVCWWIPQAQAQFRISGRVEVVLSGPERDELWAEFGPPQRKWFSLPAPGSAWDAKDAKDMDIVNGAMPPHFCVCKLHVDFVDFFDQKEYQREQFEKRDGNDEWIVQRVHC